MRTDLKHGVYVCKFCLREMLEIHSFIQEVYIELVSEIAEVTGVVTVIRECHPCLEMVDPFFLFVFLPPSSPSQYRPRTKTVEVCMGKVALQLVPALWYSRISSYLHRQHPIEAPFES